MNSHVVLDHPPASSIRAGLLSSIVLHAAGVAALALFGTSAGHLTTDPAGRGIRLSLEALPHVPEEKPNEPELQDPLIPAADPLKLGIADGIAETETWLGYKDPTPHSATPATIDQASFSIASGPIVEQGKVGGESPEAQEAVDAPADAAQPPASHELAAAQAAAEQVSPEVTAAVPPNSDQPVATPSAATVPAAQATDDASTQLPEPQQPRPDSPARPIEDAPLDTPEALPPSELVAPVTDQPPVESVASPTSAGDADVPTPETSTVDEPADTKPSDDTPQGKVNAPQGPPVDLPSPTEPRDSAPGLDQPSPDPQANDQQPSPLQEHPPTTTDPRPTPPSPASPTSQAPAIKGARPGTSGRPGELTDQYADPTSLLRDVVDVVPGRPAAAKGLKIKTTPPQWGVTTTLIRSARNPIVWIRFGRNGKVVAADFVKGYSSGAPDVDGPLLDAIHEWRAEGDELKKIPDRKNAGITVTMRITLRSI